MSLFYSNRQGINTNVITPLPTGTNHIGTVTIDNTASAINLGTVDISQVNPGVTNKVSIGTDGIVSLANQNKATYIVSGTGYTAYATPQDMLTIRGSASKKVAILQMGIRVSTTAATLMVINWIKRSAVNTGGTSTNPTPLSLDSTSAAGTAQVDLYTALPTLGTTVGTLATQNVLSVVPTAVPGAVLLTNAISFLATVNTASKPIILNSAAESLCLNFNGAALPAGFTAGWEVSWIEY